MRTINKNDIIGRRSGKLEVIYYSYSKRLSHKNGTTVRHFYVCKCECGNTRVVERSRIMREYVYSCGCSRRHRNDIGRKDKFYMVYRKKDDAIVAVGSSRECAKQLGRSLSAFYTLASRGLNNKSRKYEVIITKEKEDEDLGDTNEE